MNHYIERCRSCHTVTNQCRCPSTTKDQLWTICVACNEKDIGKLTEERAIVMALANWAGTHVLPADNELTMICDAALKFAASTRY